MINQAPHRPSRLAKQESKRLAKQTTLIILFTLAFIILFLFVGIPSLMKLAVALGNAKSSSRFQAQEDTLAPLPPQLAPLDEATMSATISVEGYTEAGAVVTLQHNGENAGENTADNQGMFIFPNITLETGDNRFSAVAKDAAGNTSQLSSIQTVTLDTEEPTLTIDSPKNGDAIYGLLNQMIDVTGSTDPEVQVMLNDRQLVVTGSGMFSTKYQLNEGDNTLKFVATDKAGNQTTTEISVSFYR